MTKPEWDIELFRKQARAGLQGWYLHYLSELDTTEGLMGPFATEDAALSIQQLILKTDLAINTSIMADSTLPVAYFAPWHHIQVIPLTPHEFDCLAYGVETEK